VPGSRQPRWQGRAGALLRWWAPATRLRQRAGGPTPGRPPSAGEVAREPVQAAVHGIDWLVRNIETGRFERSLAALAGVGSLITAAEIYFEHDRASFGNRMMWLPVALGPLGLASGIAGAVDKRAAKTLLPATSALIVANGLQGTYLHARGVGQRPGGWRLTRYNMEMGPPLLAPLLMTMVGGMGLLAAILRREGE
jgi:hypothetical protein